VSDVVLDASALLALLGEESGSDVVASAIGSAAISSVNLAEVAGKLVERGMPDDAVRHTLLGLGLDVHAFEVEDALAVGALRAKTRDAGLSLGDRACLALGAKLERPVLTSDQSWRALKLGISVRVVR
jgi:PIN domain nuclease of toxin-antitoxin system